jgi:hypothetical protein
MKIELYDRLGIKRIVQTVIEADYAPKLMKHGRKFYAYDHPLWAGAKDVAGAAYRECDVHDLGPTIADQVAAERKRKGEK